MICEYPVKIHPSSPLHWARYWPGLQRIHSKNIAKRQNLVVWLAKLCADSQSCWVTIRLTDLREYVRDYRPALDAFFHVLQTGYFVDEDTTEESTIKPKILEPEIKAEIDLLSNDLVFIPPKFKISETVSNVNVNPNPDIVKLAIEKGRADLEPVIKWIQQQSNLALCFDRAGTLQQRDTCTWPIRALECWPRWLRKELFGGGIDLDAAYIQFLLSQLQKSGVSVDLLFPDLKRLIHNKEAIRKELVELTGSSEEVIKSVLMGLANGSKVSPGILMSDSEHSAIRQLLGKQNPQDAVLIGERLKRIGDQFTSARKIVCLGLGNSASRKNQSKVFKAYFEWEREARYAIWEGIGRRGLMVHDGIEGVSIDQAELDKLMLDVGIKMSRK